MQIETTIPLAEEILDDWKGIIAADYPGYHNHVYRMLHYCLALQPADAEQREKLIIAACFHDIGIWIDDTIDYIPPSIPPMLDYLKGRGLGRWDEEIGLMISEHHKLRRYTDPRFPLVELFRRGDLIDFSFGLFRFGVSRSDIKQLKSAFGNAGFHRNLIKRAARWFPKRPLNPLPMMKW